MASLDGSKIIMTLSVDEDGEPAAGGGDASEATLQDILTELETPVDYLPPQPVTNDSTLTRGTIAITTATDTTLVSGTASQTTRLHRIAITVSAACTITFKSASTSLGAFDFPSTGGVLVLDFNSYPWFRTAAAEALVLTTSAAINVKGVFDYVKGV